MPIGVWTTTKELLPDSSDPSPPPPPPPPPPLRVLLSLSAVLTSLDGSKEVEVEMSSVVQSLEDAEALGKQAAVALMEKGGQAIMAEIRLQNGVTPAAQ